MNGPNKISYKEAVDFLMPRHYSGRKPSISYSFGYFKDGKLTAVCTFGKPASPYLCVGVCGSQYSNKVYELNRLCVDGAMSKPLSSFVSWCLRQLRSENLIIVSYADTQMSHVGYIYQATNFIYTGMTKSRTDKYVSGGKHSRHYDKSIGNSIRKFRSPKHRYIYFACDKQHKRIYMNNLKYNELPYPKGMNKRYKLGSFIDTILVDKNGRMLNETKEA